MFKFSPVKTAISAFVATSVLTLSGCVVVIGHDKDMQTQTHEKTYQAADVQQVNINAGAGSLAITGADTNQIKLSAVLYSGSGQVEVVDNLTVKQNGDTVEINSKVWQPFQNSWQEAERIDLKLVVPNSVSLDISDDSGDIVIRNMKNSITVVDGSGSIELDEIQGNVNIEDGSGDIELLNVSGRLNIEDGSGSIELVAIDGQINIEDASGDVDVKNASSNIKINDLSGDIKLSDVAGKAEISDASGDIKLVNVNQYQLLEDGSGSLQVIN
ncbi:DUF4097 family beta strand repeat protein [Catenovulum sp. SM1970]|uniref:DUF4097 family beta strand repeat-containing protein n=1 Tax=Marinifaba aquimaris TaxID=2741323 RepID=UPI0015721E96|nr:DUF4097 family beta strand repeat-containing protein [Marinifaba aquimaris]NTS76823.1 DUF4097 family beta strand repeat protein [Marinifaba aquimaris]